MNESFGDFLFMQGTVKRAVIWAGIIFAFFLLLVDIRYMTSFHYLPSFSANPDIRNETGELISAFPHNEIYRLASNSALLFICFLRLFLNKRKAMGTALSVGVFLRFFLLIHETRTNIFPIAGLHSEAADVVIGEWIKYFLSVILLLVAMIVSYLKTGDWKTALKNPAE